MHQTNLDATCSPQIVGGLAASSWVAFDPIPAAVKFAATVVQFVLISG